MPAMPPGGFVGARVPPMFNVMRSSFFWHNLQNNNDHMHGEQRTKMLHQWRLEGLRGRWRDLPRHWYASSTSLLFSFIT